MVIPRFVACQVLLGRVVAAYNILEDHVAHRLCPVLVTAIVLE